MIPLGWADFPSIEMHPERVLYRIHRAINDPVHFSSSDTNRFDVLGVADVGSCYLAASAIGAYVETLGRFATVTDTDIEERHLAEIALARDLRLADLTERLVLGQFGITGDISAGTEYGRCQAVAARLYEAGFDGIHYAARHDPEFTERSVAIFGGPGQDKILTAKTGPIPDELIEEARVEFGIVVHPTS